MLGFDVSLLVALLSLLVASAALLTTGFPSSWSWWRAYNTGPAIDPQRLDAKDPDLLADLLDELGRDLPLLVRDLPDGEIKALIRQAADNKTLSAPSEISAFVRRSWPSISDEMNRNGLTGDHLRMKAAMIMRARLSWTMAAPSSHRRKVKAQRLVNVWKEVLASLGSAMRTNPWINALLEILRELMAMLGLDIEHVLDLPRPSKRRPGEYVGR
jgi:hypothetical protein